MHQRNVQHVLQGTIAFLDKDQRQTQCLVWYHEGRLTRLKTAYSKWYRKDVYRCNKIK